ncbi:hypothetical protein BDP27DRAFT_1284103 [Rhodocollybia butyracea]|uniref:C2 domain-containing protein n=1 Tax=Rhodocollybia butyracea TaxID=206335 RepID=A0A9P5UDM6_9AGAR|nr:hypothetical protein BDP27DRAFT_1284103 [Rhodocollybia butyracea]
MTTTPREIGTLVVVVLKANHLPNKRHIGKQDPYCAVTLNNQTRRTKAIKKGGQHPEWDEEIRFQLYEDDEEPSKTKLNSGTPPPPPPKNDKILKIKGGTFMKVACYADDAREPDLIGDGLVDLKEVITKGESDEWYTLTYKDRFAGKVYLEMTLYSNEPEPPKKRKATTLPTAEYIGPGVFIPEGGQSNRIVSASMVQDQSRRQSDSYSSIRPSSSLAQLDLYQAPYEQNQAVDSLTRSMGEFGISNNRRISSVSSYRPASSAGFSTVSSQSSYELGQPQLPYPGEHDSVQPSAYRPPPPPTRKARYSIPTSSSGFMPLSNSVSSLHSSTSSVFSMPHATGSSYLPPPSQTPAPYHHYPPAPSVMYDAGGYSLPSQTPLPMNGTTAAYDAGVYPPIPSQTPFPSSYSSNIHSSHSFENGSSILTHSESYPYPNQGSEFPLQLAPPSQATPPETYTVTSPSRDNLSSSAGPGGSRPLPPQPQGFIQPPPLPYGTYMNAPAPSNLNGFPSVPPPPPIPRRSTSPLNGSPQPHYMNENHVAALPSTLPVPPPPQTPLRRTSLPPPPVHANSYPSLPALPPPSDFRGIPPPPPVGSHIQQFYPPGPPPRPPTQPAYYHEPPQNVYTD